ncbi:MAG TPA: ABC transporter ATP-binding protein [Polyangia bacterium]|nr:ABC transporter ATP-binding protein [Polyangia bacterium]
MSEAATATASGGPPAEAIGCSHVWTRFGAVVANRDVSLSVMRGEVHAVIGENGAGKSTLMRALYGMHPPDAGEVRIGGEIIARPSVPAAIARKVGMVHQHFMLVPTLTAAENVVLGREPWRGPFVDLRRAEREIGELSERFGLRVEPRRLVSSLSVGEAQRVEIVKVLWRGADVLILDEPTAVLTPLEVGELFGVLRELVADGKTVVLVTHKLDEVLQLATRVTVMRRGEVVGSLDPRNTTAGELARTMVGRDLVAAPPRPIFAGESRERLRVEGLTVTRDDGTRALDDVSLSVRGGEILGVAGVEGNGQSELTLAIAGVIAQRSGRILVDGHDVSHDSVRARRDRGVAHVPEDRHARGVVLGFSIADNVRLGDDALDGAKLAKVTRSVIDRLDVRPPEPRATMATLSGGNQQKVVVGRELSREHGVLVCAQPTRGVDVGAIERIHAEIAHARVAGKAVLLVSADLDELFALADRIGVLFRGRVVGCVDNVPERRAELRGEIAALMLGAGT